MTGSIDYINKYENKINSLIGNNDILEGFYYFLKNSKINELSSQYNYLLAVNRFLKGIDVDIDQISLNNYSIYLGQLEGRSASYRIVQYAALKKFSKYLYAIKKNEDDWMQYLDKPKYIETEDTRRKRDCGYLSISEVNRYKTNLYNGIGSNEAKCKQKNWKERDIAIITIFLSTGIRLSALYKLDIDDVDIYNKLLTVNEKGSKNRVIGLNEDACNKINNWIIKRKEILEDDNERALFISNRKKRISTQAISNIVSKYGYGIKDITISPHKLRHTFGTNLYQKTKDISLTQYALGHNNVHTTELYINGKDVQIEKIANITQTLF